MPLTPRQTHKGIPLHSEAKGGGLKETVGEIPPEWRCALDLGVLKQPVPYDTEIPLLSDTILSTRVEQDFTSESTLFQVTKPAGIVTLEETYTDKFKQVGSRTKKFRPITDLPLIGLPSATRDVNTKNFGNYHFEETLEDSGTLFVEQMYSVERPDSAPEHFKELLPLYSSSQVQPGIAALPVLGDSEYRKEEAQRDVFTKVVKTTARPPPDNQVLGMWKMTPEQEIAQGVDILDSDPLNISTINARTVEASAEDLGDGTWTKHQVDVLTDIFHAQKYSAERDLLGNLPPEFRSGIGHISVSAIIEGIAAPPTLTGTFDYESEEQLTMFKKKVEAKELDFTSIEDIIDYRMTPDQQLETITKELSTSAPTPHSFNAETVESEIRTLGGGKWLTVEGTVPDVFSKQLYSRERNILGAIPAEFRVGIQTISTAHEEAGIAADPGALTGTIESATEQQTTEFKKKVEQRELDFSVLGTLTNYKMTPEQQLESLTVELTNIPPTPSSFTAETVESEIKELGGALWLVTEGTVPDVFAKQVYEKSRPEVWPERFRALVPLFTDRHVEDGVAHVPTLSTVDVRKSESQETRFKKILETTTRDLPDLPTTHLHGQKYEDTFDLVLPYDEWIDTAGVNIGTPRAVVTPQGDGTEQVEQIDYSSISDALNAYSLVFPGVTTMNGKLPDILSDLVSVFEVNSGNGTYSETGAGYWSIRGSYSLTIRGSGNGSAAVVSDASFLLVPPFFPVKPTTRAVFFLPAPVTPAAVLTRLTAIMGSSVSAWPDFQPKPVTVVCTSKKVSVKAEANQHTQSGGSAITDSEGDPCTEADCTSCDASSTSGIGSSTEVGLTVKTIRIPPSIHGAIALHDHQDEGATARAYAFDGSSWGSCVPPEFGAADTGTIDLTATGKVDCDAPATPLTMYPTSGIHLLDASAQPYKYGFAMIHTEVFDFADL